MLVLQSGYLTPSLSLHDAVTGARQGEIHLKDSFNGLAQHGDRIYAGGGAGGLVYELRLDGPKIEQLRAIATTISPDPSRNFTGDVVVSPDGATLFAADIVANTISVIDRASGRLLRSIETCRMPYRLLLHPNRQELLVTSWSDAEVLRHELASGRIL